MSSPNQQQSTNHQSKPRVARSKRAGRGKPGDRPLFEPNAAGIDIGAREIFVAVPPDRDTDPVRKCPTFTEDLRQMAEWLVSCGITTAAMESTGVYWIPVYDVLEQHGIKPCLVNPRNMKNVPGKRTDFHECQWIQYLHSMGLLHSAFRPDADVCAVRSLMRHRNDLVQMASQHVQHMQKALTQMNVQIHHVISDTTGLTGLAILDAIVAGERNPAVLASLRDPRVKASEDTIRKSLEGNWRPEHVLALKQRLSLYRFYQEQINDCDKEIEKLVAAFEPRVDPDEKPLPEDRKREQRKRKKKGNPDFNMRTEAYKLFGVDLTQVPGLMMLVFMLFSEVGRDMSRWPTASPLRFVARPVPRQRHQRRESPVERSPPNEKPCRDSIPTGGPLVAPRPDADGRLSSSHESQTGSGSGDNSDRAQSCNHLLHDGEKPG